MLDLGFEPQLRRMAAQLLPQRQTHPSLVGDRHPFSEPSRHLPRRQTLLFSATWPREVASLAPSCDPVWPPPAFTGA